jgi:quercetin dioxygenase-like cupin family protein
MQTVGPAHLFTYGGASFNVYHANKGEGLPRHEHTFKHATVCNAGSCVIRKEGREKVIDKHTQPIDLAANEWHEIEALEDNTVFVNIFVNEGL